MRSGKQGVALLEVLVALAILGLAGLSTVLVMQESLRSQSGLELREREVTTASRVLAALSLLKGAELTQRIGEHRIGEFIARISRPQPGLFRVALSMVWAPEQEVLVTVVYRP